MVIGDGRHLYDITNVTSVWADTPEQARELLGDDVTVLRMELVHTDGADLTDPHAYDEWVSNRP